MSTNVRGNTIGSVPESGPAGDSWSAWRNWAATIGKAINYLLRGGRGVGLNTSVGDAAYSILPIDQIIETSTAFTAARIWTLPPASAVDAGYEISIIDAVAAITATNTLTIAPSSPDTIDASTRALVLTVSGSAITLVSDGLANWGIKSELGSFSTRAVVNLNDAAAPALTGATAEFVAADAAGVSNVFNVVIGGGAFYVVTRANGTLAAPTQVLAGDGIGGYGSAGRGTATYRLGTGGTAIWARENWTEIANGSYISFDTISVGAIGPALHRIHVRDGITINDAAGTEPTGGDKGAGSLNIAGRHYINGKGIANLEALTFATLPGTPTLGMIACISDSTTVVWGAVAAGTGANKVALFYNGANWTVMGA